MRAGSEEAAFLEYKERPTHGRLTALLTAVQDRVYNICFQILRRPEDAEDACQEILIELTRGLASLGAPRPFKVWLYRVAVHTALDRKESLARQARLALQASTAKPEGTPMNETERAELMRAIRTLDDRTRCMVLEHYFDKLTLEEIGAREGVSAVAVFKRLDRARESLRRALLGAGFTVAAAGVAQSLEAVIPVVAPAGLVGKAAIIKAALIAAEGAVVGTKSAITGGTIVAALFLVGAATTGGFLAGNNRATARVRELQEQVAKLSLPRAIATPDPAPGAIETIVDVPAAPPKAPEPKSEESHLKGKSATGGSPVVYPETVRYGRPEKPRQDDLLDAETWDDFYKLAREQKGLGATAFEELIFQRATRDLGLDTRETQALRKVFDAERIETTRAIVVDAGGPEGYAKVLDDLGMNSKAIFDDWRRQREVIRQATNTEYLKLLTYDQLAFFNEHLRNSEIGFEVSYGPEHVHYFITGVGKK